GEHGDQCRYLHHAMGHDPHHRMKSRRKHRREPLSIVVYTGERDDEGKPIVKARYTGMHCLRHFFASWCINRVADGGLGLPPKVVQERLGHSSIIMTMDVYGHLFPRGDDAEELAAAERALLA
ncbi:MAG: hypothetical protein E5Y79_14720, partial [Mesorhizobium sp.]|uniref:tyrosine-type recombinase/integrase n=1 Tax=Mesorhizobium sp. TaxID=1871066 RepID=UPI0011F45E30